MLLAVKYALRYETLEEAAAAMAIDLMRDDPRAFKSGYSLENALLAVREQFGFNNGEWVICEGTIREFIADRSRLFPGLGVGWPE